MMLSEDQVMFESVSSMCVIEFSDDTPRVDIDLGWFYFRMSTIFSAQFNEHQLWPT